ncbi:MAG TPA: FHA domain-containing protein [Xanthomonadaceae bacterium]|nr:FHA domain-containing protein [Xanthomonadaceae bacterium]
MRLGFPNGESSDRVIQRGELRIGRAADNDLVLDTPGIEPHHAVLTLDTRGAILWLLSAQASAHVNARPVRERAMLRLGDSVSLGNVRFVLKPDSDSQVLSESGAGLPTLDSAAQAQQKDAPARAVLRGMSGLLCGQVVPVRSRIVLGSGADADVRLEDDGCAEHAWSIEGDGQRLLLRALDPSSRAELNGIEVRDAALHPGDQVSFGHTRFLVEAPGLLQRGQIGGGGSDRDTPNITQTMRAVTAEDGAAPAAGAAGSSSLNVWLLIGAALIIAAVIAGLLLIEF